VPESAAKSLNGIREQRRQDQTRNRDLGGQKAANTGNQDHGHAKTNRALDETGQQDDEDRKRYQRVGNT